MEEPSGTGSRGTSRDRFSVGAAVASTDGDSRTLPTT